MGYDFVAEDHDQLFLMPPAITDWLPEDDLAYFGLDAVEAMDLTTFYADYRADGWGVAARHPKTMVALLLYGYCTGVAPPAGSSVPATSMSLSLWCAATWRLTTPRSRGSGRATRPR